MGKIGRPTKYREEMCERVVELGSEGCSFAEMANDLDVSRDTLYKWRKRYPNFADALSRARLASLAWWTKKGREGVGEGSDFNDRQWKMMVSNMFPDDWQDTRNINVRGAVLHLGQDQLARLPDPLLSRIAQGEDPTAVLASVAGDVLGQVTAGEGSEDVEEAEVVDTKAPEEGPGG